MRDVATASACLRRARAGSRGQVLLPAVGLLMAGCVLLWMLHGAGRSTAAKQRLTDATDAAAYSVAVWRARVLNFDAYANRAIVAQEVSIAQAVTLASWAGYFEQLMANAATVSQIYPPAAAATEALHDVAVLAKEAAQVSAELEVTSRGAALVGYSALLQQAQEQMHHSANAFALTSLASEVVEASDPRFFAHLLPGDTFSRFTRRWSTVEDRTRLADVVRESLDGFTGGARSADVQLIPFMPSGCLFSFERERMFDWLRKRGATTLSPELDRWEAQDTLSLHAWRSRSGLFGSRRCSESESVPLGWAAAEATGEPLGVATGDAHDTGRNARARSMAGDDMAAFERYGGIQSVRELDYGSAPDRRFPTSRIAVLGRVDMAELRPADPVDGGDGAARVGRGRLALDTAHARGRLWALSAAQVDFTRPPSAGGAEYASLYSPYWQARLVAPTDAERAEAQRRAN